MSFLQNYYSLSLTEAGHVRPRAPRVLRNYVTENKCFGPQSSGFGNYLFRTVTVFRTPVRAEGTSRCRIMHRTLEVSKEFP